jgi:L-2-hydroxyglutarate oxidase
MSERRILVVGGGAVGLATAWRILEREPRVQLTLVEKEPGVARHQTGNNSGVLHCGLQADLVARLGGVRPDVRIVAFRGDYYKLRPEREFLVRNLIYPVADPKLPFLGVHFTRRVRGGVKAGPNAVLSLDREGYGRLDMNLRDAADALTFPGLWRFLGKHLSTCVDEVHRAISRALFCRTLQNLLPELREDDLLEGGSGVRAQGLCRTGSRASPVPNHRTCR